MGRIKVYGGSQSGAVINALVADVETPYDLRVYHEACNTSRDGLNWHTMKSRETQTRKTAAMNIQMPMYFSDFSAARQYQQRHGAEIWSRKFNTEAGQGITKALVPSANYWVEFVPSVSEWRVNVGKFPSGVYEVLGGGKKILRQDGERLDWRLSCMGRIPAEVQRVARITGLAIGYDFSGVDVLMTDEGEAVVIEANKSPDIRGAETSAWYVDFFKAWAQVGYRA